MMEKYDPAMYTPDDRIEGYRAAADMLVHIAERCGVEVDETTRTRWHDAMGLLREFDTFVDEECQEQRVAMATLRDFSLFAPRYPSLAPEALGGSVFETALERVETILEVGNQIAEETDPDSFIELRKAEAYYTTTLLEIFATPAVRDQAGFNECMWRFTGLGIGGNLIDSLLDARWDYVRGETRLKPTLAFYRSLGKDAVGHMRPHLYTILDKEGLKLRAKGMGHRVMHRLTHGITPHSNLHIMESLWRRHPK